MGRNPASSGLESRVKDRAIQLGMFTGTALVSGASAWVGSYVGEGVGYVFGHIMDALPLAEKLAPMLAERSGLLAHAANPEMFNVDFYQTVGAGTGALIGLFVPLAYGVHKMIKQGP